MVSATLYLFSTIETLSQVLAYVTLFGLAYGGIIPLRGVLQGYFFGRTSFGTVGGFLQFVDLPATVAAPWFIGFLADEIAGGYRLGFKLIALFVLIAVLRYLRQNGPESRYLAMPPLTFSKFFQEELKLEYVTAIGDVSSGAIANRFSGETVGPQNHNVLYSGL
jgi:hypothetical protein